MNGTNPLFLLYDYEGNDGERKIGRGRSRSYAKKERDSLLRDLLFCLCDRRERCFIVSLRAMLRPTLCMTSLAPARSLVVRSVEFQDFAVHLEIWTYMNDACLEKAIYIYRYS
jgi:hypothetical protein